MACNQNMGFARPEWGFDGITENLPALKRKFRWIFSIPNVTTGSFDSLPCIRASRPKLEYREMQAEHINETISFPSKPQWNPVQLVMYDKCMNKENPIFTWLRLQYDPKPSGTCSVDDSGNLSCSLNCPTCNDDCAEWFPCVTALSFKTCGYLTLMDGCGNVIEGWVFEHMYPQSVDFGELDMTSSDVVTVDATFRYDRAFQIYPNESHTLFNTSTCVSCNVDPCSSLPAPPPPPDDEGSLADFAAPTPDFMMI